MLALYAQQIIFFIWHCRSWGVKLKIRLVKLSDEGAYSCVANNSEGTVSKQVFLTVTGMIVFFNRDLCNHNIITACPLMGKRLFCEMSLGA